MKISPTILLEQKFGERSREFDPIERRKGMEYIQLEALCERYGMLSLETQDSGSPPEHFRVKISGLRSIARISNTGQPEFSEEHLLDIRLPVSYPLEAPVLYMLTDTWHPNIQSEAGPFRGRICGNHPSFASTTSLDNLVLRIVDMLAYKVYNADFTFPFPEDEEAAKWVLRFGEPLGIVKKGKGIVSEEWPREKADRILQNTERFYSLRN